MSRVVSNSNLSRVENIHSNSGSSILADLCVAAVAGVATLAMKELFSEIKLSTSKVNNNRTSTAKSTVACREELTSMFTQNYEVQSKSSKALIRSKTAFIKSLSGAGFRVENGKKVEQNVSAVLNTTSFKEFNKKADILIKEIEHQNNNILQNEITAKIKEASCEIGFTKIKHIQNISGQVVFTCENNIGQALVHELHIDHKTYQIDHIYEYVDDRDTVCGIDSNVCDATVTKFQKSLESKGVSFSTSQKKPTGGNAVLPFSKEVKKLLKQKSKNESVSRTRRLNRQANHNKL